MWEKVMAVNATSYFVASKHFLRHFLARAGEAGLSTRLGGVCAGGLAAARG